MTTTSELPRGLSDCLVAAQSGRSRSRARQLSWVTSELAAFAAQQSDRRPTRTMDWFDAGFLARYLESADAGRLRRRGGTGRPSPDATRRVRRACLQLLADTVGAHEVPKGVALPPPGSRVDDTTAMRALGHWRGRAHPATAQPGQVRTAAMAVLIRETGMRSGELAGLVLDDLDLRSGTIAYQPRPPSARTLPPARTVELTRTAVGVLRHWLDVRATLTDKTPRTRSLWVSLAANHDGSGVRRPAGMPLQPTGLRRAHARAVAAFNLELAGSPGFDPLPRTVGRFRPDEE